MHLGTLMLTGSRMAKRSYGRRSIQRNGSFTLDRRVVAERRLLFNAPGSMQTTGSPPSQTYWFYLRESRPKLDTNLADQTVVQSPTQTEPCP